MLAPEDDVARVADAHCRLSASLEGVTDDVARRPSRLPGWSVGHVLTHLARNADSHVRRVEGARRGEMVDQYPGGPAARAAAIDAGAIRSAAELVEDVRTAAEASDRAWLEVPPEVWPARSRDANGRVRRLFELPARRWQEVEVHLVDLDVGVTWFDWPDEFVVAFLGRTRERMGDQLAPGWVDLDFGSPAEELAWLYGRLQREDLPPPPVWS